MYFVYLDEFGHIGPFISRKSDRFNESPVFGLGGIILPQEVVRPFATRFLKLKEHVFSREIVKARTIPQKWEKKGSDIFRPKAVTKYPEIRSCGFRLINMVRSSGGRIFYQGREKIRNKFDGNATGLYKTVFSQAIRRLDGYFSQTNRNFALVVDEHSARPELLECAEKTMYGREPARRLISPPFEVESYLNQNIQAADWTAAIIGRLWAHELAPEQYVDYAQFRQYYWDRLHQVADQSSVLKRKGDLPSMPSTTLYVETSMAIAFRKSGLF